MALIDYIEHHPSIAFCVGIVHIGLARFLHSVEIPLIVMQLFQIGAWTITIVVGLITIYGFIKKLHDGKSKKRTNR